MPVSSPWQFIPACSLLDDSWWESTQVPKVNSCMHSRFHFPAFMISFSIHSCFHFYLYIIICTPSLPSMHSCFHSQSSIHQCFYLLFHIPVTNAPFFHSVDSTYEGFNSRIPFPFCHTQGSILSWFRSTYQRYLQWDCGELWVCFTRWPSPSVYFWHRYWALARLGRRGEGGGGE